MKAMVIDRPGGPERLRLSDVPAPQPGPDEVLVEVAYAGCNWADIQVCHGTYPHPLAFPMIPGFEVAGTVVAAGRDVVRFRIGDRVCGILPAAGGYAQSAVAQERFLMDLPAGISMDVGAAFPIQALTAYHLLHTIYQIKPGDVVLVHAIGGGVGLYVTQLAVMAGAIVIGTTGTEGKERLPLQFGARKVINTGEADFVEAVLELTAGRGADLAIDSLGGNTLDRTFAAMKYLGHVINIGEAESLPLANLRERILPKSLSFTRFHLLHVEPGSALWLDGVRRVKQAILEDRLFVPVVERFPLERAAEMLRRLESRAVAGKLLLSVA